MKTGKKLEPKFGYYESNPMNRNFAKRQKLDLDVGFIFILRNNYR